MYQVTCPMQNLHKIEVSIRNLYVNTHTAPFRVLVLLTHTIMYKYEYKNSNYFLLAIQTLHIYDSTHVHILILACITLWFTILHHKFYSKIVTAC